jgi:hypothetical protein
MHDPTGVGQGARGCAIVSERCCGDRRGTRSLARRHRIRASHATDRIDGRGREPRTPIAFEVFWPIAREVFWGPMAYTMMGAIIVGTVLTLIGLPALYVAWFRISPPPSDGQIDGDAELTWAEK